MKVSTYNLPQNSGEVFVIKIESKDLKKERKKFKKWLKEYWPPVYPAMLVYAGAPLTFKDIDAWVTYQNFELERKF